MDPQVTETPAPDTGATRTRKAGATRPGWPARAWTAFTEIHPSTVFFLVALSLGLGAVAPQMSYLPLLVVFAVVWGVTVVALMGTVSRWIEHGRHHGGRPRAVTGH